MRYYAVKANVCYDIDEEQIAIYENRGFTITPYEINPVETEPVAPIEEAKVELEPQEEVEKPEPMVKAKKTKASK